MKNTLRKFLLLGSILVLAINLLIGQKDSDKVIWENLHPSPEKDAFVDGLEMMDGAIALAGNLDWDAEKKVGKQAFLKVIYTKEKDQEIKSKFIRYFPSLHGNGVHAMVQTSDNHLFLAGYVLTPKGRQKKDFQKTGWIIKVDHWGNKIWEKSLDDLPRKLAGEFKDIALLDPNGTELVAVGEYGGKSWMLKIDGDGNVLDNKIGNKGNSRINSIIAQTNTIAITGSESGKPFFKELNEQLQRTKTETQLPIRKAGQGIDLFYHPTDRTYYLLMAIGQLSKKRKDFDQYQLLKLWKEKNTQQWISVAMIPGKLTHLTCLNRGGNGQLLSGGYSRVLPEYLVGRGSKVYNPIYITFEEENPKTYLPHAELVSKSSKRGDKIHQLFSTNDRGLVFVGEKDVGGNGIVDAWMVKSRSPQLMTADITIQVQIDSLAYVGQRLGEDTLRYGSRGHLYVDLSGTNEQTIYGLRAAIHVSNPVHGLHSDQEVLLRPLSKGSSRQNIRIPIYADAELFSDQTFAKINIYDAYDNVIYRSVDSTRIITQSGPSPWLKIVDYDFLQTTRDSLPKRGDTIRVNFQIRNFGEATAKDVVITVKVPYMIRVLGEHLVRIDSLVPGQVERQTFQFVAHPLFLYDHIPIQCMTYEEDQLYIDYISISKKISSYFSMVLPGGKNFIPVPSDWIRKYRGGPQAEHWEFDLKLDQTPIEWGFGEYNQKLIKKGGTVYRKYIVLKAIIHDKRIQPKNIVVLHNGKQLKPERIEFDPVSGKANKADLQKCYAIELFLDPGENVIQLMDKKNKHLVSEEIKLTFKRPNIHFFAIGMHYPKSWGRLYLNTALWVNNIWSLMKRQEDSNLYNKVIPQMLLTGQDSTSKAFINQTLIQLRSYSQKHHPMGIQNHDIIVFYAAGHGMGPGKTSHFFLVPSGNDPVPAMKYEDNLVAFKAILANLNTFTCETLVLLDACESGRALEDDQDIQGSTKLKELSTKYFHELVSPHAGPTISIMTASHPTSNAYHFDFSKNLKLALAGEKRKIKLEDEKGTMRTYYRAVSKTKYASMQQLTQFCQGLYNMEGKNEMLYYNQGLNPFPFFEIF